MNGITVLSVGEYVETIGGAWSFMAALLLVFGIIVALAGAITFLVSKGAGTAIGLFACFIGGCMLASSSREYKNSGPQINIPQYKITISDSVPYNEFVEKYEVLNIEGKIYTVIDKVEYETAKAEVEGG